MNYHITDEAFELMYNFLYGQSAIHTKDKPKIRIFLEAVHWMARSGAQWRLLPSEYGNWNTVFRRFQDWSHKGIWKRMFLYFSTDKDMEWLMIDSTIIRAHACASGGKGGEKFRELDALRAAIAARYTSVVTH